MNTSKSLNELTKKLFEDLYTVPYHPTDIDACHLHEKHTPQCYGCRHAKWSNIIKAELRERFDNLTAKQELEAAIVDAVEGLIQNNRNCQCDLIASQCMCDRVYVKLLQAIKEWQ